MDDDIKIVKRMYDAFNARDIDGVLAVLAPDVSWANGMDGGYVHGRDAVRAYWTQQWAQVDPRVEPVSFARASDGAIVARVRQTVFDLDGRPLAGQAHGLTDKMVGHVFHLADGAVVRFDLRDNA